MSAVRLRLVAAALLAVALQACAGGLGRQYEYEEQLTLGADGSASIIVNASIPALVALRGLPIDTAPRARIDRDEVRAMVAEPGLEITRVSRPWRRDGRQFLQIRAEVADVEQLASTRLFGWSDYDVATTDTNAREYRQRVGEPADAASAAVKAAGWDGSELVAFKLHLPSRIHAHNVRLLETRATGQVERGNILTWEQHLSQRLAGAPIEMHVTMESGSILYRTLWLFAMSFGAAVGLLIAIIWWVIRRGRRQAPESRS